MVERIEVESSLKGKRSLEKFLQKMLIHITVIPTWGGIRILAVDEEVNGGWSITVFREEVDERHPF